MMSSEPLAVRPWRRTVGNDVERTASTSRSWRPCSRRAARCATHSRRTVIELDILAALPLSELERTGADRRDATCRRARPSPRCRMAVCPQSGLRQRSEEKRCRAGRALITTVCGFGGFHADDPSDAVSPAELRQAAPLGRGIQPALQRQTTSSAVVIAPLWNLTPLRSGTCRSCRPCEMVPALRQHRPDRRVLAECDQASTNVAITPSVLASRLVPGSVERMSALNRARSSVSAPRAPVWPKRACDQRHQADIAMAVDAAMRILRIMTPWPSLADRRPLRRPPCRAV